MEKKQVYISFNNGEYRIFQPYESVIVEDKENTHFRIECSTSEGPIRTLLLNKGSVKFIDIGPVYDQ